MLGMYLRDDALVSLRSGTGNQFPGTPADHPSCLQDSQEGLQANFYTFNVNSLGGDSPSGGLFL